MREQTEELFCLSKPIQDSLAGESSLEQMIIVKVEKKKLLL